MGLGKQQVERRVRGAALVCLLACALVATSSLAAKGGNGGGGGKPDGGGDPPADPAITYMMSKRAHLMRMDAGGTNQEVVERNVQGFGPEPAWSHDGAEIAYNATFDGPGIYVIGADGTNRRRIADLATQYVSGPAWSPGSSLDGNEYVAFDDEGADVPAGSGNRDIFLVQPDGTGRFSLTHTPDQSDIQPTWSPDGTRMAVRVGNMRDGAWHADVFVHVLHVVDGQLAILSTTNVTNVPGSPLRDAESLWGIDWAKTQDLIAVSAAVPTDPDGQRDIWVIDPDDPANPVNLTGPISASHRHPTWSADDSEIAYRRSASGRKQTGVFVMNADGTNHRMLTDDGTYPDWRRAP